MDGDDVHSGFLMPVVVGFQDVGCELRVISSSIGGKRDLVLHKREA
jgi:hypothetical protein